jgi:hypothetical protein
MVKNVKSILSVLILCFVMGPLLIGGCSGDKKHSPTAPSHTWLPQTSPQNVIDNLTEAIAERDSVIYAAQLADSFQGLLYFDFGEPPGTWGKAIEITGVSRLFRGAVNRDGYVSESIGFSWLMSAPDTTMEFPTWTRIVMTDLNVIVNSHNQRTGALLQYVVSGMETHLWFEKTGSEWRIVRWEDNPRTAFSQEPVTFGIIKLLWRSGPVDGAPPPEPDR